jgi:hypothetical protein
MAALLLGLTVVIVLLWRAVVLLTRLVALTAQVGAAPFPAPSIPLESRLATLQEARHAVRPRKKP